MPNATTHHTIEALLSYAAFLRRIAPGPITELYLLGLGGWVSLCLDARSIRFSNFGLGRYPTACG